MPDANSIKDLPDTSKIDDSKAYLVPGKWLVTIFDILTQLWRGENVNKGPNIRLRQYGLGGYSVSGANQTGESSSTSAPWQIYMRVNPDNPAQFQAMVNTNSDLLKSLKPNDNLAVTGLGTWFPLIANDVIALYIVVSNYEPVSATIQSYGMGTTTFDPELAAWNSGDNSYVFNDGGSPPNQIGINLLLGYSTPDGSGNPYFIQACSNHLLIENCAIDGWPAIYPFPAPDRRYGITAP